MWDYTNKNKRFSSTQEHSPASSHTPESLVFSSGMDAHSQAALGLDEPPRLRIKVGTVSYLVFIATQWSFSL